LDVLQAGGDCFMELWVKFLILALVVLTFWGMVLGWTKRAIFYMDMNDLLLTFLGWVILALSLYLAALLNWEWVAYSGAVIAIGFAGYTVYRAFVHNGQAIIAIPVGIAKVLLSFLYVVSWVQLFYPGGGSSRSRNQDRASALIVISLLSILFTKLINGYEVSQIRLASASS